MALSPTSAFQRAAAFSYTLVDEVHSLVDEDTPHHPRRLDSRIKKLTVAGLIGFGTLISTLGKLAYELEAVGRDGFSRSFQKPWFLVLLMFIGMSLNLFLSLFLDLVRLSKRPKYVRQPEHLYTPLRMYDCHDEEVMLTPFRQESPVALSTASPRFRLLDRHLLVLLVPTLFDLVGSALLNVGLLTVTASAAQMLRQSLLLFAALLGVALLGKKFNRYHAAGLTGCMVGLLLVIGACLGSGFGGSSAPADRGIMAAGIGLILASQLVAAGQLLIDQGWYANRLQLSPLKVVGCEGVLGAAITVLVVLPIAHISHVPAEGWGLREDTWDTLAMVASRPLLQLLLLVYTGCLQAYNICGMVAAGELSAVDTTLLQAVRTLFVWILNLLIYAAASALTPGTGEQSQPRQGSRVGLAAVEATGQQASTLPATPAVGSASAAMAALSDSLLQQQQQGGHVLLYIGRKLSSTLWQHSTPHVSRLWHMFASVSLRHLMQQAPDMHQLQQQTLLVSQPASAAAASGVSPLLGASNSRGSSLGSLPAATGTAVAAIRSSVPTAVLQQALDNHNWGLSGEPWMAWSFLQAAGFVVLVGAAITYSKGDNERLRRQMEDEAALIMLDQPPSGAGSVHNLRHFTAHMDIDTASYLRSFTPNRRDRDMVYGITPVPSQSLDSARDTLLERQGSGSLTGFLEGLEANWGPNQATPSTTTAATWSPNQATPPDTAAALQSSGKCETPPVMVQAEAQVTAAACDLHAVQLNGDSSSARKTGAAVSQDKDVEGSSQGLQRFGTVVVS